MPRRSLTVLLVPRRADDGSLSLADLRWAQEITPLATPEEALEYPCTAEDRAVIASARRLLIVGDPKTVAARLTAVAAETSAAEPMITTNVHGHAERLRSYELVAEATTAARAGQQLPTRQGRGC